MAKQCESTSSQGYRCEKPRRHVKTDQQLMHKSGPWVWRADHGPATGQGARANQIIFDETHLFRTTTHQAMEAIGEALAQESAFDTLTGPGPTPELELRGWWFDLAEKEIEATVPKAVEYSSTDLIDIGRTMAFCMGREVSDEEAAELGIFFYMQGKMSRWAGAIKTGQRVSDDTLFDIGIYVRMAQRVRDAGGWPGTKVEA